LQVLNNQLINDGNGLVNFLVP